MCWPMSLLMPKPVTFFFPKTASSFSSHRISFRLLGFCRSFALIYFQSSLTIRKWFARPMPTTAVISSDSGGCPGSSSSSASAPGAAPGAAAAPPPVRSLVTCSLNHALFSPASSTSSAASTSLRRLFRFAASRSRSLSTASSRAATRFRRSRVASSRSASAAAAAATSAAASSAARSFFASCLALRAAFFLAFSSSCTVSRDALRANRIDMASRGLARWRAGSKTWSRGAAARWRPGLGRA
mmetsp:Transcript_22629/g.70975  ORF Transcript_22629/g.70975 Transcript_22629/m.70975 type:complete len:242 (+) Transcript_22629:223-948(+)